MLAFPKMSLAPQLIIGTADGFFDFDRAIHQCLEIMRLKDAGTRSWAPADYVSESQQALVDMTEATKPASVHRRSNRNGKSFYDLSRYKRSALKRWAIALDKASYSDISFIPSPMLDQSLQVSQISYVWNNLNGRFTVTWKDIDNILANLWGFKVNDIDSIPQDQRMKAMLYALGYILKLLFQYPTLPTEEGSPGR